MKKKIDMSKVCWGYGKFGGGNLDIMTKNAKELQKAINHFKKKNDIESVDKIHFLLTGKKRLINKIK